MNFFNGNVTEFADGSQESCTASKKCVQVAGYFLT